MTGKIVGARGVPIEGARVTSDPMGVSLAEAETPTAPHVFTEADGRFVLERLAPGSSTLHVRANAHDDYLLHVELPAATRTDLGVIELSPYPWAAIHGTVRDAHGNPIAGARITRFGDAVRDSREVLSDADGGYRMARVRPGRFLLGCEFDRCSITVEVEAPPAFDVRKDFDAPRGTLFLGGTVVCAGEPVPDLQVEIESATAPATAWTTRTDEEGHFRLDGLTDEARFLALWRDDPWQIVEFESLELDRDDHVLEFPALPPLLRVHGTVRDESGAPIADAVVESASSGDERARVRTDSSGRFELSLRLSPDVGRTLLASSRDHCSARALLDRHAVSADGVLEIDFTLVSVRDCGTIEGVVTDERGRPVTGAACVAVWNALSVPKQSTRAITDSRGRFTTGPLPAGPVEVVVRTHDDRSASVATTIVPSERAQLDIRLGDVDRVDLVVVARDPAGRAIRDALVTAWEPDGPAHAWGRTDADGRVLLRDLPLGSVRFLVEVPSGIECAQDVFVSPESSATGLELVALSGNQTVDGTVRRADGTPADRVEVVVRGVSRTPAYVLAVRRTGDDGRFRVTGLPDGDYEVTAWSPEGEVRQVVAVPGGGCDLRLP